MGRQWNKKERSKVAWEGAVRSRSLFSVTQRHIPERQPFLWLVGAGGDQSPLGWHRANVS